MRKTLFVLALALGCVSAEARHLVRPHNAPSSSCPQGTAFPDGCPGAPAGATVQHSDFFTAYAPQSGQVYVTRPPWNVAGVDYAVGYPGYPSTGGLHSAISSSDITNFMPAAAGCVLAGNSATLTCTLTGNATIDGWNFANVVLHTVGTGNLTVEHSFFQWGANMVNGANLDNLGLFGHTGSLTMLANAVDGNAAAWQQTGHGTSDFTLLNTVTSLTSEYNAFLNNPARIYTVAGNSSFTQKYDYIDDINITPAKFTASITSSTMAVTAVSFGTIPTSRINFTLMGPGFGADQYYLFADAGGGGGTGNYTLSTNASTQVNVADRASQPYQLIAAHGDGILFNASSGTTPIQDTEYTTWLAKRGTNNGATAFNTPAESAGVTLNNWIVDNNVYVANSDPDTYQSVTASHLIGDNHAIVVLSSEFKNNYLDPTGAFQCIQPIYSAGSGAPSASGNVNLLTLSDPNINGTSGNPHCITSVSTPSVPSITNASKSMPITQVANHAAVNTMSATNSPTAWAITSCSAACAGWFAIDSAGAVTLTATGAGAFDSGPYFLTHGTYTLGVTASNAGGTSSPGTDTVTITVPNESADLTTVYAGSVATSITDSFGNGWTILAGKVAANGVSDSTTSNVIQLAYANSLVWYENSSFAWFFKSSPTAAWTSGKAPIVFAVSGGQIIDPSGAAWKGYGIAYSEYGNGAAGFASIQRLFPRTTAIRFPLHYTSGVTPSQTAAFVNAATAAHVMVIIEDHDLANDVLSGAALTAEVNWYNSFGAFYVHNPYVTYQTMNEPGISDSAQMQAIYNGLRSVGYNGIIFLEAGQGAGGIAGTFGSTTWVGSAVNVGWDLHCYNWQSNKSTNVTTIQNDQNSRVATYQAIQSSDGVMPVMSIEAGISTNGTTPDAGGVQNVQATFTNSTLQGVVAWDWDFAVLNNLTTVNGCAPAACAVSTYGAQVQSLIP